jgi:hypothetical protein
MYGNVGTRSVRALAQLITHPRQAVLWARDRIAPSTPVSRGLPWISWPAVGFLERFVTQDMAVFEWGGGGSTVFFAARGARVTCVETDPAWADAVVHAARARRLEVTLRLIDIRADPGRREEYLRTVCESGPWDVILVDSWEGPPLSRLDCIRASREQVRAGGVLVLDDAWRDEYRQAPQLLAGFSRRRYTGLGPCRWGVTRTDVYTRIQGLGRD